jgi:hypothetical protein
MTRELIILLVACTAYIHSNGQETALCRCDSLYGEIVEPKLTGDLFLEQKTGTVSPFYIDDWLDGTIQLSNDGTVKNKNLKYNGHIDRVIWQTMNLQQVKLDKESVEAFTLYDKVQHLSYVFQKITIKEELAADSINVYAQLLYKNNISLYAYRKVVLTRTNEEQKNRYITEVYEKRTFYYIKFPDNKTSGFRRISKRNILKLFPEKKDQVINLLSAAKQHKFKTEEDLIQVAELLNRIK